MRITNNVFNDIHSLRFLDNSGKLPEWARGRFPKVIQPHPPSFKLIFALHLVNASGRSP
ncbi:hypothetical protein ACE1CI_30725 [Aerosakkonemataceae cyanobacterium BLCC-F50]|uniref:Uncharacterized protein n=1 Tax=Floridaenema flaviceps BLCC-F50 TaxID=3153642 RepID=A0ABV4XZZ6_9CYAN